MIYSISYKLTFQSIVLKNECLLISSTPSGPAPEISSPKYLMNRLKNAPNLLSMNNLFFETSWQWSFSPKRLPGFLLNRLRSRDWASGLRNWGIPSLALEEQKTMSVQRLRYENQYWGNKAHFKIIVMVSLRSFPWNGSVPVSISN